MKVLLINGSPRAKGNTSIALAEVAKILEAAGASLICVHARTREQMYKPYADYDIIRQVKEAVSIPVIGNGDVTGPESAKKMIEETGVDGIMIGRAARGNPWIFGQIKEYLETGVVIELEEAEVSVATTLDKKISDANIWYEANQKGVAKLDKQGNYKNNYKTSGNDGEYNSLRVAGDPGIEDPNAEGRYRYANISGDSSAVSYKCRIYGCSRSIYYRIHKFVSFRNHDLLNISLGRGF